MNQKIGDLYAPIYERAMRADKRIYQYMYDRIPQTIADKAVLEIATGPGLLAKHVAVPAKQMIATDYSDGMIAAPTMSCWLRRDSTISSTPARLSWNKAKRTGSAASIPLASG